MNVTSLVIEVDVSNAESSINTVLADAAIDADRFLQAIIFSEEQKNKKAKLIIFYEEE